jgi:hypothetical protein
MPLGRGIVEVFEAIPERIEVSGHGPTWRVTAGSFESALAYAREAFGDAVVVDREDRSRWWPRVTLTVTCDADLAAEAPPVETFADPALAASDARPPERADGLADDGSEEPAGPDRSEEVDGERFGSALEDIFAHQEELRVARSRIPQQRGRRR